MQGAYTRGVVTTPSQPSPWMQRALEHASLVWNVSPNPGVGCVLVRDGEVVGEGHTEPPPGPHAEVVALAVAGARAHGATAYVTLEPCSHWGRTPPCVDALIAAGVSTVSCAILDPDSRVHGSGVARLRAAGVVVTVGDGARQARRTLAAYRKHRTTGWPLVTVKFAASLDGKIATHTGDSRWISSPATRAATRLARARVDAILVGSGTALADDPQLTSRNPDGTHTARQPLRVLLDRRGRTPPSARLFDADARTLVFTAIAAPAWRAAIEARAVEVITLDSQPSAEWLRDMLTVLGTRGVLTLLVEGGSGVHGAFFDAGLVDRVQAILAPLVIGGAGAPTAVSGIGAARLADVTRLREAEVRHRDDDILVDGWLRDPDQPFAKSPN